MKPYAAALALLSLPASACDWQVTEMVSPMNDGRACHIRSDAANLSLFVYPTHITFGTGSAYRNRSTLHVRIDDNPAIVFGRNRSTSSHFPPDSQAGRDVIEQIQTGQRIRVSFSDYPEHGTGDAAICNLPELIRACQP